MPGMFSNHIVQCAVEISGQVPHVKLRGHTKTRYLSARAFEGREGGGVHFVSTLYFSNHLDSVVILF